jgi:hypothetical protein
MRSVTLFALLFTAFATSAAQPAPADAPGGASPAGAGEVVRKEDDKLVCERRKSNMMERVCMTESQRDIAREQARRQLQGSGACSGSLACGGSN